MRSIQQRKHVTSYLMVLAGLIMLFSLVGGSATFIQDEPVYLKEVRAIDTNDLGLLNPAGLAFSLDANVFFVLEAHSTTQANIAMMTPAEELVATASVNVFMMDPINLAFDNPVNRLLLYDTASRELVAIKAGPDGHLDLSPETIIRFQVGQLDLQEPRGMTVDPANGNLFILDSAALQIVRIEPDAEGGFDGVAALDEGRVSRVDLTQPGLVDPRGLALNPSNGHLYLLSSVGRSMYELNERGRVVAIFQLPPFEFVDPQGLVFAFSGDATDDPSIINVYIADTGLSAGLSPAAAPVGQRAASDSPATSEFHLYPSCIVQAANVKNDPGQELGRIMELSLPTVDEAFLLYLPIFRNHR